jgi:hypothetical protein
MMPSIKIRLLLVLPLESQSIVAHETQSFKLKLHSSFREVPRLGSRQGDANRGRLKLKLDIRYT